MTNQQPLVTSNVPDKIVTPDQIATLKQALIDSDKIAKHIVDAKKAGIDMSAQEKQMIDNRAKITQFLSVYDK